MTLILAILLVAPKFIGGVLQQEREDVLVELNQIEGITLTTNEYKPRWFGADVISKLTFTHKKTGLKNVSLVVEEELSFGPVIVTTDQGWHLGLGYSEVNFKFSSADIDEEVITIINEKIQLGALLNFSSDVITFINIDEFSHQHRDERIASAPITAQFTFVNDKHVIGDFSWEGFEYFNQSGERTVMSNLAIVSDQQVVSGDYLQGTAIVTGELSIKVGSFDMYDTPGEVYSLTDEGLTYATVAEHNFSLSDAGLTTVISLDNDLLSFTLKHHAKNINVLEQNLDNTNLEVELANVDLYALQELKTALVNSSMPPVTNLLDIVDAQPTLKVSDLSLVTKEGKVVTELNVSFNRDLIDFNNFSSMALLTGLEANAKGQAPLAYLAKIGAAAMVDNLVEQGYLTKQDNDIIFIAEYEENQLMLNGKVFHTIPVH